MKNYSIVYKTFHNKYDFVIAWYISSGWRIGNLNYINILALKNKKWKKIVLTYPDYKRDQIKLKKTAFKKEKAHSLIKYLTDQNFWTLTNDSLNHQDIKPKTLAQNYVKNDTIFVVANADHHMRVLDGSSDYFEILQDDKLRFYYTSDPEVYLRHFPKIKSRAYFIRSRNAFFKALND